MKRKIIQLQSARLQAWWQSRIQNCLLDLLSLYYTNNVYRFQLLWQFFSYNFKVMKQAYSKFLVAILKKIRTSPAKSGVLTGPPPVGQEIKCSLTFSWSKSKWNFEGSHHNANMILPKTCKLTLDGLPAVVRLTVKKVYLSVIYRLKTFEDLHLTKEHA